MIKLFLKIKNKLNKNKVVQREECVQKESSVSVARTEDTIFVNKFCKACTEDIKNPCIMCMIKMDCIENPCEKSNCNEYIQYICNNEKYNDLHTLLTRTMISDPCITCRNKYNNDNDSCNNCPKLECYNADMREYYTDDIQYMATLLKYRRALVNSLEETNKKLEIFLDVMNDKKYGEDE